MHSGPTTRAHRPACAGAPANHQVTCPRRPGAHPRRPVSQALYSRLLTTRLRNPSSTPSASANIHARAVIFSCRPIRSSPKVRTATWCQRSVIVCAPAIVRVLRAESSQAVCVILVLSVISLFGEHLNLYLLRCCSRIVCYIDGYVFVVLRR